MSRYPDRYRGVSVTDVDVPLELGPLRELLMSRQVYRRTQYMVVRNAGRAALVEIHKSTSAPLFCDVDDVELLAGPEETAYVHRPDLDTALPTDLVKAVPHVAFEVDDLPAALAGRHVIIEPNSPSRGVIVAFIEVGGAPVELMQIDHQARPDL